MYKISIQYTNPFKRYRTETKSVTYGTDGTGRDGTGWADGGDGWDGRMYGQRWYYMPPHWKWRGHNEIVFHKGVKIDFMASLK